MTATGEPPRNPSRGASAPQRGGDGSCYIRRFFAEAGLTLASMKPDDALVGGDPTRWQRIHDGRTCLVYLTNPTGDDPGKDDVAASVPGVIVGLSKGSYTAQWFEPSTGRWHGEETVAGRSEVLTDPGAGDWVLWLQL